MKILKVSQTYYPYLERGGPPAKVKELAEHLAHRHEVTVLTSWLGRTSYAEKLSEARPRSACAHPSANGGHGRSPVKAIYLPYLARYRALTINPSVAWFCLQSLQTYDIVHLYGVYDFLGPVVAGFCRRRKIPYVLEPVGMFRPIVRHIGLKRAYRRLFGWPVVEGAARVVATSELERDRLVADGVPSHKTLVRRNGFDLSEFDRLPPRGAFRREIGLHDDVPLVLYIGRLSRVKGLDMLVEAFSDLPAPAALAIIGPDDRDGCAQDLVKLSRRLGLQERLHLLGPRFGKAKLSAFADADTFVLPSYSESFGNAAAEAIACGVPVVVTESCGIAPIVREAGGLVVPGRLEALRSALARLVTDSALRARLRRGALAVRHALSWDEPVAQMERVYMECIAGTPVPGRAMISGTQAAP